MQRIILGRTGLNVPVFCVGTAHLNTLPRNIGLQVLQRAYELGAVWWDTSGSYGTEPLVGEAIAQMSRQFLTISTKTYAAEHHEAEQAVKVARERLGIEKIDIMFMHDVHDREDWERRQGCLEALSDLRAQGIVRTIGFSSHRAEMIHLAAGVQEIDTVMAPWNAYGQMPDGVGSMREMEVAIHACYAARKGVVLMKVLNDGKLRPYLDDALHAAARFKEKHAICIGVSSVLELETDIRMLLGQPVDASILRYLKSGHSDGREAA